MMDGSVYNNLGSRINKSNQNFREKRDSELFTLKDIIDHKWIINNNDELKKVFARELKTVLKMEDLFELINGFFELENDLSHVLDLVDFEVRALNFDEFYKNLSPVLMRALLENSNQPDNAPVILKSIKESLRIALEEELHQLDDQF